MKTYTKKELKKILDNHALWLKDNTKGERANLYDTNLSNADLSNTDLSHADLFHTNLSNANLSYANLSDADLFGSNLIDANLSRTKGIMSFNSGKDTICVWERNGEVIVKIGCKELSLEEWIKDGKKIGKEHDYADLEIKLYLDVLKTIKKNWK